MVAPPPPTAVVTATGETTHVGQPAVATVTQGAPMMPTVPAPQPTVYPAQPGYPNQPAPPGYPGYSAPPGYSAQPGYQPPGYPSANTETPYPPIPTAPPPDQYPPVPDSTGSYPPAQPVQHDVSGQPVSTDPAQQANNNEEDMEECVCYCCIL